MASNIILSTAISFGLLYSLQSQELAQLNNAKDNHETKETSKRAGSNKVRSTTVTYPTPTNLETSSVFTVKVNDTAVWTEQVGGGTMEGLNVANFSCSGPQTIKITAPSRISSYVIRPKSRGIA